MLIGFQYDGDTISNHKITRKNMAHRISCINQPESPWVNLVYPIMDDLVPSEAQIQIGFLSPEKILSCLTTAILAI